MTDDTLCFTPATELAGLLRARQLSPVELVTAVLARAERLQPVLNCFVTLVPERALAEARRAEEDIVAGRPRPDDTHQAVRCLLSFHCLTSATISS